MVVGKTCGVVTMGKCGIYVSGVIYIYVKYIIIAKAGTRNGTERKTMNEKDEYFFSGTKIFIVCSLFFYTIIYIVRGFRVFF